MNDKIREIVEEIEAMKLKLSEEIAEQESNISYEIQNGYVKFEKDVLQRQKENMKNLLAYFREEPLLHFLTAPIIYGMVIPAILLDVIIFIYQQVVFRIFKLKFLKRSDYIVFDRHYLGYLNPIEKFNCVYCSYVGGLLQYTSAIAARTEFYFCPIKHAKKVAYDHEYYQDYLIYGDAEDYHKKLKELRKKP
ncbi:MAG: hypothetical protein KC427_00400 [Sulfurovum sp.]|uniref:hypothetical protein n=1 Tax=Sulfurovum sp. TaxID=1969726 RepID=UPI002867D918|nr:hypothetical protein [Sulfurovum sp.]MCO4844456.1 hypothetical protein [Sulfurovum sp.]